MRIITGRSCASWPDKEMQIVISYPADIQWAGAAFAFLISFKCQTFFSWLGLSWISYQFLGYLEDRHRPAFVFHNLRLPTKPLCEIERIDFLKYTREYTRVGMLNKLVKFLNSFNVSNIIFLFYYSFFTIDLRY